MNNEMIEGLKRAYAEALYESKRHDQAAEAIAVAILCLSGEKVTPPMAAKAEEVQTQPLGVMSHEAENPPVAAKAEEVQTAEPITMDPLGLKAAKKEASARLAEARRVMKLDQLAPGAAPKISRKAAKSAKTDYKKAKAERQAKAHALSRTCQYCGDQYLAKRRDQTNCLAPACRKAAKDAWKETHADARIQAQVASKAAQTVAQERGENGGLTRLERIRAAAERLDGIPESVRAAVAEARESEVM